MMSSETASVLKRKFDDVAHNNNEESFATTSQSPHETKKKQPPQSTIRSSSFLPCHLKMLRALYVDTTVVSYCGLNIYTAVATSKMNDGAVSGEVWDMIQRFLEDRHELRRIKNEAQRWRAIVDESKGFVEHHRPTTVSAKNTSTTSKSPLMWQPTSPPLEKRLFASPYAMSSASTKAKSGTSSSAGSKSMALVSKLLERRACVAENKARKVGNPFYELYTAVCKRAERLDSLLESSNLEEQERSTLLISNKEGSVEKESNKVEADAKNKLWKILAHDLYNVIKI